MSRAAVYVRLSKALDRDPETGELDERNLPIQRKRLQQEAKRLGVDEVVVFEEPGHSAYKESLDADRESRVRRRPVFFGKLWPALERREFDYLMATEVDRLTRFTVVGAELAHLSDQAGFTIVCPGQATHRPGDDHLLFVLHCSLAQSESRTKSERMKRYWERRRESGKLMTLGRRPFGLRREGDRLVQVPAEARAIRKAARQLIRGRSLYSVVQELPPTPYGRSWRPQHFRRALLSDHLVTWGVLDGDTHRLVMARLEAQPTPGPGRPRRRYALSGLVVCSLCGSKLAASSGAFHCQDSKCGKVGIQADRLDPLILDELVRRVPDEEDLPAPVPDGDGDEAPILRELAEIEERIRSLTDNVSISEDMLARRGRALEARRDELQRELGRPREREDSRQWLVDWAREGFPEPTLPTDEDSRELYRSLIKRITVKPATRGRWTPTKQRVDITWR